MSRHARRKRSSLRTIMHSEIPEASRPAPRTPGARRFRTAGGPAGRNRCFTFAERLMRSLLLELDHGLQVLVCRRDALRVGFEGALGQDHLRELVRDRDVRLLERARIDRSQRTAIREAVLCQSRVGRGRELVLAQPREAALVRERRQRELDRAWYSARW